MSLAELWSGFWVGKVRGGRPWQEVRTVAVGWRRQGHHTGARRTQTVTDKPESQTTVLVLQVCRHRVRPEFCRLSPSSIGRRKENHVPGYWRKKCLHWNPWLGGLAAEVWNSKRAGLSTGPGSELAYTVDARPAHCAPTDEPQGTTKGRNCSRGEQHPLKE